MVAVAGRSSTAATSAPVSSRPARGRPRRPRPRQRPRLWPGGCSDRRCSGWTIGLLLSGLSFGTMGKDVERPRRRLIALARPDPSGEPRPRGRLLRDSDRDARAPGRRVLDLLRVATARRGGRRPGGVPARHGAAAVALAGRPRRRSPCWARSSSSAAAGLGLGHHATPRSPATQERCSGSQSRCCRSRLRCWCSAGSPRLLYGAAPRASSCVAGVARAWVVLVFGDVVRPAAVVAERVAVRAPGPDAAPGLQVGAVPGADRWWPPL